MKITESGLPGVLIVEPRVFHDERGFFLETFNAESMSGSGIPSAFFQDNHSRSSERVLRGLHYQLDRPQGKLVHVARGRIFDVAVDIRVDSPNFGRWFGLYLDDENLRSLWIPPGFAHGFQVLSKTADVIYKCTDSYSAIDDRGVLWNDPRIGIDWPLADPIISSKDLTYAGLESSRTDLPPFRG